MERRDFIFKSGIMGGAMVLPALSSCRRSTEDDSGNFYTPLRKKVMMVMLATQRQNWEHGIASQTFVEIGDKVMMILMAKEAVLKQGDDGRLAVIGFANGINDSATTLEAVLRSALLLDDHKFTEAAEKMIHYLFETAPRTQDGYIHHSYHGPELWADSIYMAPPFLAYAGYPQEAVMQYRGISERLWNEQESLFSYRWNAETGEITHPQFWALANAHAISGMTKLADYLPAALENEKTEITGHVKKHLQGCLSHIRPDHLFHNNINEPDTFVETSLSARLAWTIFTGIQQGWLENKYLETAMDMRKAVYGKVDEYGNVIGVPGSPSYSFPGRSVEGQAFFLMMEAAYDKLNHKLSV